MMVFIDESGIHNQKGQSATALVYVKIEHVENVNEAVLRAEKDLKISPFHWKDQSWKIRKLFLKAIAQEEFEVKIFVFQNPFTKEKLEHAWKHLLVEKNVKNIIIDGKKSREYVLRLKKVLRFSGIFAKKIRMGNDKSFPGLRIADLFAGLCRAHTDIPQNPNAKELFEIAENKITIRLRGWSGAG